VSFLNSWLKCKQWEIFSGDTKSSATLIQEKIFLIALLEFFPLGEGSCIPILFGFFCFLMIEPQIVNLATLLHLTPPVGFLAMAEKIRSTRGNFAQLTSFQLKYWSAL
jgi:hypothetical protein